MILSLDRFFEEAAMMSTILLLLLLCTMFRKGRKLYVSVSVHERIENARKTVECLNYTINFMEKINSNISINTMTINKLKV